MVDGPKTELQSRSASVSLVAPVLRRRRWDLCYIGRSHVVAPVSFSAAFWEGGGGELQIRLSVSKNKDRMPFSGKRS